MTPDEFRAARRKLGLSAQRMADALGIAEGRTIRHYEAGTRAISGPVSLLTRYIIKYGLPEKALRSRVHAPQKPNGRSRAR